MYRKTQHSVYNITLHLVLVVKDRCNVIDIIISNRIKEIFETIGLSHGVKIFDWTYDGDHIQTVLSISPSTNLNKYVNACKTVSSRLIKKEFPNVTLKLYRGSFWTRGFYVTSKGSHQVDDINRYIWNQGKNSC